MTCDKYVHVHIGMHVYVKYILLGRDYDIVDGKKYIKSIYNILFSLFCILYVSLTFHELDVFTNKRYL